MPRFGQLPFLTCVVFGIGLALGVLWKSGQIPIEIGAARTGQLSEDESSPSSEVLPETSESPDIVQTAATELAAEDPAIFDQQSEPAVEEGTNSAAPPSRLHVSATEATPLRATSNDQRAASSEPGWATQGSPHMAAETVTAGAQAVAVPARTRSNSAVRQAGHREPAALSGEAVATETSLTDELATIDELIASGETLAAHRALSKLYWNHKLHRAELQSRLDGTAKAVFFQPQPHFVEPYVIEPNDQLRVIASKYQLSWEYLAKLNKTDPRRIQQGQKLKVVKGPFAAVVDLQDFALTVHLQGYYVKRYDVGIGKDGSSPLGKFAVQNKVENPQYTGPDGKVISSDDPTNPLGERWIDLGDSYGIHGTIDPDSIGQAASRGCIRLRDKDVVEVYDFLVKGSEVVIRK